MPKPEARRPEGSSWNGVAQVRLPAKRRTATQELIFRLLLALGLLALLTVIVYLDRGSYADHTTGRPLDLIDAFYYATVTMTTTGYGDITPITTSARLINAVVITPIRIAFLILLVSTTVEVLANEGRRALLDSRWRKTMRSHTVVIGYGTTGQSAVATLLRADRLREQIVVIDADSAAVATANSHGLAAFEGDATSRELLRQAEVAKAREIIVTVARDDTAILTTLTVRQLNHQAHVVVAVRDSQNVALIRQSGADSVITSSDAVGRLMGLSSASPQLGQVIEDLLTSGDGLEVHQRIVTASEDGVAAKDIPGEKVLAVIRNKTLRRFFEPGADVVHTGDEIVVVRHALPTLAPRVE
jgi:voltage-gated potassium channel